MGCCGKKLKNIVKGYAQHAAEQTIGIYKKTPATLARIAKCENCDYHTWFSKQEYITWLIKNAGTIRKGLDGLDKLPQLVIKKRRKGTGLFCSVCKCFIPAKARIENEKCSLGKW